MIKYLRKKIIKSYQFDHRRIKNSNIDIFREKLNLSSVEKGSSDNISTVIVFLRPIQDIIKGKEIFFAAVGNLLSTELIKKYLVISADYPEWKTQSRTD